MLKIKAIVKLETIVILLGNTTHGIYNLSLTVPNKIPVVLPNGVNYGYHFIRKELTIKFKSQFECLGEKTEKYKTFSVPPEKEIRKVAKDSNEDITVSYRIKLIHSARFLVSLLSYLVDNLAEGIHKIKCKDYNCFLEYKCVNDNLIKYKCLTRNKNYSNKIDEKLKNKRFKNIFDFSNNDTEVVCPY